MTAHAPALAAQETMGRWWGAAAKAAASGASTGFVAAWWRWEDDGIREAEGTASPSTNVVSVSLAPVATEFSLDGRGVFRGTFRPGQQAIIPAGSVPRGVHSGPVQKVHFYVSNDLLARCAAAEGLDVASDSVTLAASSIVEDADLYALGRRVRAELSANNPANALLLDAFAIEVGAVLVRRWSNVGGRTGERSTASEGKLSPWRVNRALAYLHDRLDEDVSLSELAAEVGLSPFHFSRAFRATLGVPPHRYRLELRVAKARALLVETSLSIADVAASVGFDDPSYFARVFRRMTGRSPVRFRDELRS